MKVYLEVSKYYDWVPTTADEKEQIDAVRQAHQEAKAQVEEGQVVDDPIWPFVFKDSTSGFLKRITIERPSYTEIHVPPQQVEVAIKARDIPAKDTPEAMLFFTKHHMQHNAPEEAITKIIVEECGETHDLLNEHFNLETNHD